MNDCIIEDKTSPHVTRWFISRRPGGYVREMQDGYLGLKDFKSFENACANANYATAPTVVTWVKED